MDEQRDEREALRAKARRWLHVLYFCFVVLVVIACLANLLRKVTAPDARDDTVRCAPDIEGLMSAVERARAAACKTELDEDEAVSAFHSALSPEWDRWTAIRRACSESPALRETLDAIQYLRYAEENTVRRESSELASLRRRARELLDRNVREASWPLQPPSR
jgi:hypothetical protein